MSTFFFQEPKTKFSFLQNNLWMLWVSLAIFKFITWFSTSSKLDLFVSICFLLAAIMMFIGKKKQIKTYISILQNGIEWLEPNNGEKGNSLTPTILEWTAIKRIKFEDDGVSLYQESSFNNFISFKKLTDTDRIACVYEIAEQAKVHSIELITK